MKRVLPLIFAVMLWHMPVRARETADSVYVYYRAGYRYVELDYRDNRVNLSRFVAAIRHAADTGDLERVVIRSGASPDGTQRANDRLVKLRADSLAAYLVRAAGISADLVEKQPAGILWDRLRERVSASDMPYRDEVLYILDNEPLWTFDEKNRVVGSRKKTLMDLHGGRPYNYMLCRFFPDLRNGALALLYVKASEENPGTGVPEPNTPAGEETMPAIPAADAPAMLQDSVAIRAEAPDTSAAGENPKPESPERACPSEEPGRAPDIETAESGISGGTVKSSPANNRDEKGFDACSEKWSPGIRVKTNAIGWAMMMMNAAVEFDLSRHLSINLPVYYSACNYFTTKVKFRMLATQPELRIWPLRERRLFAGVHFGVASYNLALGGKWRIQDHGGNTPALGGGINVGYRIPLGRSERWNVEFSLGAGIYRAHYDRFYNESNGAYSSTVRKTFIGLDNAAVSFSYKFDLKKTRK